MKLSDWKTLLPLFSFIALFRAFWVNFKKIVLHRWYFFYFGWKLGCPIYLLLVHDWTKFLPNEFIPYSIFFCTPKQSVFHSRDIDKETKIINAINSAFDCAKYHHWRHNKHHWQYWIKGEPLEMPKKYVLEMITDWYSAGAAYEDRKPNTRIWYSMNRNNIKLHPKTREIVDAHFFLNQ